MKHEEHEGHEEPRKELDQPDSTITPIRSTSNPLFFVSFVFFVFQSSFFSRFR